MITCKDFLRELNDFLDETTDPVLRAELEKHINECPNCWVICDTTRKTIQVYKGMEEQDLPNRVHQRLMDAIARKAAARRPGCGGSH
jgi:heterodisulfide reductase subunit B